MKSRSTKKKIALVLAASGLAVLTGCGSSPGTPAAAGVAGVAGIGGGCVPINTTSTIGFTATNMYMANPVSSTTLAVLAGLIPGGDALVSGGGTYGTMTVMPTTGAYPVTAGVQTIGTYQGYRVDGTTISMTVSSATPPTAYGSGYGSYSNFPASGLVNATGTIQLSPFMQSVLMQTALGTSTYGNSIGYGVNGIPNSNYAALATTQICVSNLAISMLTTLQNQLYQGYAYVYLTGGVMNGQHGIAIDF